jgi:hypothetical protein
VILNEVLNLSSTPLFHVHFGWKKKMSLQFCFCIFLSFLFGSPFFGVDGWIYIDKQRIFIFNGKLVWMMKLFRWKLQLFPDYNRMMDIRWGYLIDYALASITYEGASGWCGETEIGLRVYQSKWKGVYIRCSWSVGNFNIFYGLVNIWNIINSD